MAKFLVETYYTCSFKVSHYLDDIDEKNMKNIEKREDGKFEILDVKLDNRKTKNLEKIEKNTINAVDKDLNTPLHFACLNNNHLMVQLLASYPNLIQKRNISLKLPWDVAISKGNFKIIKILEEYSSICEDEILPIDVKDDFEDNLIFEFSSEEIEFLQSVLV